LKVETNIIQIGILFSVLLFVSCGEPGNLKLFNGESLEGWKGSEIAFRVEDGAIVGGNLEKPLANSYYLCTEQKYDNFELTITAKIKSNGPKGNGGVSFRAERLPNSNKVAGYQADMGHSPPQAVQKFSGVTPSDMNNPFSLWGSLIDEFRPDSSRYPIGHVVILGVANEAMIKEIVRPDDWNEIKIKANGLEIEIMINGISTVKFTEKEEVPQTGCICLQAHAGEPYEVLYKDISLKQYENQSFFSN
jgi:hypothetical protein